MKSFLLVAISALIIAFAGTNPPNSPTIDLSEEELLDLKKDTVNSFPAIMVKVQGDTVSAPLRMLELGIDVEVIGTMATTTMHMTFQNDSSRILEGMLYFPLDAEQTVSRFAMDIGGELREGVVVEKEEGRRVYEKIVRRNVDPGLLEWTKGNNFKARVYPIPANGTKSILIAYEQELKVIDGSPLYRLPLKFQEAVEKFNVKIKIHKQEFEPNLEINEIESLKFKKWEESYTAEASFSNYIPNKDLGFISPKQVEDQIIHIEKTEEGTNYFFAHIPMEIPSTDEFKPNTISIVWDASMSAEKRNFKKEYEFLAAYFKTLESVNVELITFSNDVNQKKQVFNVNKGNWEPLKQALEKVVYDGGTQLGALDFTSNNADLALFFTDGIANFGARKIITGKSPITCVNSKLPADHSYLKSIGLKTGGRYINLINKGVSESVSLMKNQPYQFISSEFVKGEGVEMYPSGSLNINGDFSFAGQLKSASGIVKLNFGANGKVEKSLEIELIPENMGSYSGMVRRMWAQKKLAELELDPEFNHEKIVSLGKEHSLVTRATSLIVLDRIEDYLDHGIEPPATLIAANEEDYKKHLAVIHEKETGALHIEQIVAKFEERKAWWEKKYAAYDSLLLIKKNVEKAINKVGADQSLWEEEYKQINKQIDDLVNKFDGEISEWEAMQIVFDTSKSQWSQVVKEYAKLSAQANQTHYVKKQAKVLNSLFSTWNTDFPTKSEEIQTSITKFHELIVLMQETLDFAETDQKKLAEDFKVFKTEIDALKLKEPCNRAEWRNKQDELLKLKDLWASILLTYETVGNKGEAYNYVSARKKELLAFFNSNNDKLNKDDKALKEFILSELASCPESDVQDEKNEIIEQMMNLITVAEDRLEDRYDMTTSHSMKIMEEMNASVGASADMAFTQDPLASINNPEEERSKNGKIEIKGWDPDTPYMRAVKAATKSARYSTYIQQKKKYGGTPSFYVDVANFFIVQKENELALKVLSNIAELETENHELLRILGYKLKECGFNKLAITVFEELKEMRGEEPQSYRDLGLVYSANGQYQEAVETLYQVVKRKWDRFNEVEMIALNELNVIVAKAQREGIRLNYKEVDNRLIKNMPVRLRVTLNWNADNTDMDLWVEEPAGEVCMYNHNRTATGGRMSRDFTNGYGPEEYLLKKALPGTYVIKAKYYGSSRQKVSGPVILSLQLFHDYGTDHEKMEEVTIELADAKEVITIGEFVLE